MNNTDRSSNATQTNVAHKKQKNATQSKLFVRTAGVSIRVALFGGQTVCEALNSEKRLNISATVQQAIKVNFSQ